MIAGVLVTVYLCDTISLIWQGIDPGSEPGNGLLAGPSREVPEEAAAPGDHQAIPPIILRRFDAPAGIVPSAIFMRMIV